MHGGGVTQGASGPTKQASASSDGLDSTGCVIRRLGGSQEAHEQGKLFDPADGIRDSGAIRVCHVVRGWTIQTSWIFVPFGLKQFISDPHFHVVGFAGKEQKRLILSLPSETGNRAVIAILIRLT